MKVPPFLDSIEFVTIFIVPPIEPIANLETPRPLTTCICEVTSPRPFQLDQNTLPFSMSLTGTPFIITVMFS